MGRKPKQQEENNNSLSSNVSLISRIVFDTPVNLKSGDTLVIDDLLKGTYHVVRKDDNDEKSQDS